MLITHVSFGAFLARYNWRPDPSMALQHCFHADFSFSVELKGHILNVATLGISLLSCFLPRFPPTFDDILASLVKPI